MTKVPLWVTVDEVVELHKYVILTSPHPDEPMGIANNSALASAVGRPLQHFFYGPEDTCDDLVFLGAKLCIGISESQAFLQGNKRTAFAAMEMFLNHNTFQISDTAVTQVAELILQTAHPNHELRLDEEGFAEKLDRYVVDLDNPMTTGGLVSRGKMNDIAVALGKLTIAEAKYSKIIALPDPRIPPLFDPDRD